MSSNQNIESFRTSDKTNDGMKANSNLNLIDMCGKNWCPQPSFSFNTATEHLPSLSLVSDRSGGTASHAKESGTTGTNHDGANTNSDHRGISGNTNSFEHKAEHPMIPGRPPIHGDPIPPSVGGVVPPERREPVAPPIGIPSGRLEPVAPPIGVVPPGKIEPVAPPIGVRPEPIEPVAPPIGIPPGKIEPVPPVTVSPPPNDHPPGTTRSDHGPDSKKNAHDHCDDDDRDHDKDRHDKEKDRHVEQDKDKHIEHYHQRHPQTDKDQNHRHVDRDKDEDREHHHDHKCDGGCGHSGPKDRDDGGTTTGKGNSGGGDGGSGKSGGGSGGGDGGSGKSGGGSSGGDGGSGKSGGGSGGGDGGSGNSGGGSSGGGSGGGDGGSGKSGGGDHAGFTEKNGKFLANGKLLNGIAIEGQDAKRLGPQQLADQLTSRFPNLNVVRLETSPGGGAFSGDQPNHTEPSNYQTVANIDADIKALNAKGVSVIVEDQAYDAKNQPNTATGATLQKETAWYGQIAKDNSGNKMLAFETPNEPIGTNANIANEQTAVYNAIRQNDKNAYVGIELVGGGSTKQLEEKTYQNMTNTFVDAHDYAFNSTNPVPNLQNEINSIKLTDANGKIPIIMGETGNAGMGPTVDRGAAKLLEAEYHDGTGVIACHYDGLRTGQWYHNGDENTMTTLNDAGLTPYGLQIQKLSNGGVS